MSEFTSRELLATVSMPSQAISPPRVVNFPKDQKTIALPTTKVTPPLFDELTSPGAGESKEIQQKFESRVPTGFAFSPTVGHLTRADFLLKQHVIALQLAAYDSMLPKDKHSMSDKNQTRRIDTHWICEFVQEQAQKKELRKDRMFHRALDSVFIGFNVGRF
jgi:hypothetical protein